MGELSDIIEAALNHVSIRPPLADTVGRLLRLRPAMTRKPAFKRLPRGATARLIRRGIIEPTHQKHPKRLDTPNYFTYPTQMHKFTNNVSYFAHKAAQCRRLAEETTDKATVAELLSMADDFDLQAVHVKWLDFRPE